MKNFQGILKELMYSFENVKFYQELFSRMEVDINKIKVPEDLEKIPFTSKVDYRRNFPKGTLAEGFTINHPMITKSQSSGTTGERLITLELGMNLLNRALSCISINPVIHKPFIKKDRKIARYAAPNCSDVECANPNSALSDRILPDKTLVLPVYHDLMTTTEKMLDSTIKEIAEYKPDLFYVDPTHFAFLLRHYKKRGLRPPNIPVMLAYTLTTECAKRQISEFYDSRLMVSELLSCTEFGWTAMECNHGSLHVNDDSFGFEYVDAGFQSPLNVTYKELCISSIDQGVSPHLRYRTGDIVSIIEGPCECGSDRQRIVIEGRSSHFLVKNGSPYMSPKQVDKLFAGASWLDCYQLEQLKETEFLLKLLVNDCYEQGVEGEFVEALQNRFKARLKVDVNIVDYIASDRSGKYQYVRGLQNNV